MNDAQLWTVIGGFFGALALIVGLVLRMVQTEIRSLRNEMVIRFETLDRDLQRLIERWFEKGV